MADPYPQQPHMPHHVAPQQQYMAPVPQQQIVQQAPPQALEGRQAGED